LIFFVAGLFLVPLFLYIWGMADNLKQALIDALNGKYPNAAESFNNRLKSIGYKIVRTGRNIDDIVPINQNDDIEQFIAQHE